MVDGRTDDPGRGDSRERARAAVLEAWQRYRDDNDGAAGLDCLLEVASQPGSLEKRGRRREEVLERMTGEGVPVELAADAYDVAVDEGVDPAFALELVRCRVGIVDQPGADAEVAPATEAWPGEWLGPAVVPDEARRERRLRTTFRRLRRLLSEHETPESALIAFTEEPDVGTCEY